MAPEPEPPADEALVPGPPEQPWEQSKVTAQAEGAAAAQPVAVPLLPEVLEAAAVQPGAARAEPPVPSDALHFHREAVEVAAVRPAAAASPVRAASADAEPAPETHLELERPRPVVAAETPDAPAPQELPPSVQLEQTAAAASVVVASARPVAQGTLTEQPGAVAPLRAVAP